MEHTAHAVQLPFLGLTNICLRRPARVENAAGELLRLAEASSLAFFHILAQIDRGWALAQQGAASGLAEMEAGLREKQQTGAERLTNFQRSLAADAYSRAGRHDEALASISRAFELLESGDEVAFAAELHRTRAAVWLRAEAGKRAAAEADLKRAFEIAHEQKALSFQLRAARDLAQIWAERGGRQQAVDLRAPIYAAFTERFDTLDLQESKALLDELKN